MHDVYVGMCAMVRVEVRGQLCIVGSLFPFTWIQGILLWDNASVHCRGRACLFDPAAWLA